jgi:hypothetical protein
MLRQRVHQASHARLTASGDREPRGCVEYPAVEGELPAPLVGWDLH